MKSKNPVFAVRLKQSRDALGLSLEGLGKKVGVSKAAISQYEAGKHVPSIDKGQLMAEVLGVGFNWLFGYSEIRYRIEVEELTGIYADLSDGGKKELYNYANYLLRKEATE